MADIWRFDAEDPASIDLWTPNEEGPRTGPSEWEIRDGWLHQTVIEEMYHKAAAGDAAWTDYSVELDMVMEESAGGTYFAGLLLRSDAGAGNGYRLVLHSQGQFQLSLWQDNAYQHIEQPAFAVQLGEEYHLRVLLEGWTLSAWGNGEPILEAFELGPGAQNFESGMLGLMNYGCHVRYDNIEVSGPAVKSLSVEPTGKLAILWGAAKGR